MDVAIETSDLRIGAPDGRLVAALAIAVVVGVAGVLGIRLRAKVLPTVRSGLSSLRSVMSTPHKRLGHQKPSDQTFTSRFQNHSLVAGAQVERRPIALAPLAS